MSEPLLAEKEINEMKAKEHQIENLIMHLGTEITYYDLKYCHSKQPPVPFLMIIASLSKVFHLMKHDARSAKIVWFSDEANKYHDFIHKKVQP